MKKIAAFAGVGAMALVGAASATAAPAPAASISGNFQYTQMSYWCDNGTPNFAFAYRTLNKTEAKVTFSATGYNPLTTYNVSPYRDSGVIYSLSSAAGKSITVWAKGSTTGSSFHVSGKVPSTCAGLPSNKPVVTWVGKPTAKPVPAPTKTTPAPTKTTPAPSKPAPTKPAPTKPAPSKPAPAPTKTEAPAPAPTTGGPKVETDYVAPSSTNTAVYALGAAGLAAAAAGTTVVARRGRK